MKLTAKLFFVVLGLNSLAFGQTLNVEIGQTRSVGEAYGNADSAVRILNTNLGKLTKGERQALARAGRYFPKQPLSFPATVWLTSGGQRLGLPARSRSRAPGLNLIFDSNGVTAFDPTYKQFLQDVYTKAQPFLDALFGLPSVGGDVAIKNADGNDGNVPPIGDREVFTGGYYIPNPVSGPPQIRFPFYGNSLKAATAINFIHTLLLAYIGPNQYGFDAFNEGLVRAATMRIARTTAFTTQLGLETEPIEQVLANTYDVEGQYDWYNQRALGGPTFIAPNLRSFPIPDAGSVGGLYLLRYKMAGAAWTKALVETKDLGYAFISNFNARFYAQPSAANNVSTLIAMGQATLNSLRPGDPTVEGMSFADWFKHQFILETKLTRGPKLLVEPIPLTSELSGNDFGVFIVQANWFETLANGDETLLSGTSYPIVWEGSVNFDRLFFPEDPGSERMTVTAGYGSIVPNIKARFGSEPFRAIVDIPILDQIERVYLPAGGIATAAQQNPRDFYGTVVGAGFQTGDTYRLEVTVNGTPIADIPVTNSAFGVLLGTTDYLGNARIVVDVVRTRLGADSTLLTRKINKGPGPLALDLRVDSEDSFSPSGGLPKGISMIGFPIDPFASLNSEVLGIADNQVLAARYNSSKAKYDLYPDLESFKVGHGYFVRLDAAQPGFNIPGRFYRNVETCVALKPGWNLIATPLLETVPTSRVRVVKIADQPQQWSEAITIDIGANFFQFTPGSPDAASGVPETGTLSPATEFEPGKAYFVRVLAPEGVTLSFQPLTSANSPLRSIAGAPSLTGWRMSVTMAYGAKQRAAVILGQSTTATRSFDPREDSGMPPGIGGFQVIVEDYEAMYRDIRPVGAGESYTLHLQGLTPGKIHPIEFKALNGKVPSLTLRDSKGKSLGTIRPGMTYNHFARSRDEYIRVVVGATK